MAEAQRMADAGSAKPEEPDSAPFPEDDLRRYMESNAAAIRATGVPKFAAVTVPRGVAVIPLI